MKDWISANRKWPPDGEVVRIARIDGVGFVTLGDARMLNGVWHCAIAPATLPDTKRPTHWKLRAS